MLCRHLFTDSHEQPGKTEQNSILTTKAGLEGSEEWQIAEGSHQGVLGQNEKQTGNFPLNVPWELGCFYRDVLLSNVSGFLFLLW